MLRLIRRLVPTVASLVAFVASPATVWAGDDVSQTRAVSGFDRIRLEGAFTANVNAGRRRTHFSMTGPADLLARVTTQVRDGTLVVGMGNDVNGHMNRPPALEIDVPVLRGFKIEGAGSANISGLTGGDVTLEIPGAASIVASGRAARETIALDGTGKIDASAVDARDVEANNNGVGLIDVRGSGSLTLNVNGVGEIRYAGNPRHVDKNVNGIGRIVPS